MLTKLTIRNFKRFGEELIEIELGNPVVFIGPEQLRQDHSHAGIGLWTLVVRRWNDKRSGKTGQKSGLA